MSWQHSRPLRWVATAIFIALCACSKEKRTVDAGQPQTPPLSANDARISRYQGNVYQIAQGGRYFIWYGCGGCHTLGAKAAPNFGDGLWRHGGEFDQVYRFIEHGHAGAAAAYGEKIPVEQLWQITAYVRDLSQQPPEKRRRLDFDQQGEPQGQTWSGPIL